MKRLLGIIALTLISTGLIAQDPSPNVQLPDGLVVARETQIGRLHVGTDFAGADAVWQQQLQQYGAFGAAIGTAAWVRANGNERLAMLLDALEQHDPDFYQAAATTYAVRKDPPVR